MSYQVLARKWRPRSFKELVGQSHVLQALVNALDQDRLHHAYLFTGTRGVGKTTIARIFAKCLNCETGVSSVPCGQCSACQEIDDGRFVDLMEVDAASRTKVEDTRELLDNVQYLPTRGRYKVYLIDEVHMLSAHSFNALLKTLEEPPPHVKFLLATTDPQKLPVTILSRCLQFSLKNMTPERIVGHLKNILDQETITSEDPALWQLARSADGSMRDALSLTDQAIAYGNGRVIESDVSAMLGTIDQGQVMKMIRALATGNAVEVLHSVALLAEHSPDYLAVLNDMLSVLHRIAIAQAVPDAVDNSQGDREQVIDIASSMTAEDIQLYYQIGLVGKKDLPMAPEPRSGFEMALLRMLAFRPDGAPIESRILNVGREVASDSVASDSVASDSGSASGDTSSSVESEPEPEPEPPVSSERVKPLQTESNEESRPASSVDSFEPPLTTAKNASVSGGMAKPSVDSELSIEKSSVSSEVKESEQVTQNPEVNQDEVPLAAYEQLMSEVPSEKAEPLQTTGESQLSSNQLSSNQVKESVYDRLENVSPEDVSAATQPVGRPAVEAKAPPKMVPESERIPLSDLNAESWVVVFRGLPLGGVTGTIGSHCEWLGFQNGQFSLRLDAQRSTLYNDTHRQRIEKALSDYFKQPVMVQVDIGVIESETPAAWRERKISERLQLAKDSIFSDARVQSLVNDFSAVVLEDSIRPVGNIIK